MSNAAEKIDIALKELLEAFSELEQDLDEKHGDDEDAYQSLLAETFESSIETAVEESGTSTTLVATLVSSLSEGLEALDPSVFEDDSDDYSISMADVTDPEVDNDDIDLDDIGDEPT